MNWDRVFFWVFVFLALSSLVQGVAEWFGWWGDPEAPHFSHGSAALIWIALAALYLRTERSNPKPGQADG